LLNSRSVRWSPLSGGQMQRSLWHGSLVYQPQLLLLDEPLSNLDAQLRCRLRDDLRGIIKQAGVTAVYVTHDQAEAVVLGDRIGVIARGKLVADGTPDAIYNRPADLFVASFHWRLEPAGGPRGDPQRRVRQGRGRGHELTALLPAGRKAGEAVKVAVRTENVRLGVNGAAATNRFTARIAGQRYQARRPSYELAVLGTRLEAFELGTSVRYAVGIDVESSWPPALCWAYPAARGKDLD